VAKEAGDFGECDAALARLGRDGVPDAVEPARRYDVLRAKRVIWKGSIGVAHLPVSINSAIASPTPGPS
jgi:hypothetical protein